MTLQTDFINSTPGSWISTLIDLRDSVLNFSVQFSQWSDAAKLATSLVNFSGIFAMHFHFSFRFVDALDTVSGNIRIALIYT